MEVLAANPLKTVKACLLSAFGRHVVSACKQTRMCCVVCRVSATVFLMYLVFYSMLMTMPVKKCCLLLLGNHSVAIFFLSVVSVQSNMQVGEAEDADGQSISTRQQTGNQSAAESNAMSESSERARAQIPAALQSQGMINASQLASPSTATALGPYGTSGETAVPQSAAMPPPNQASRQAAEPDLASAETLSPESAVTSPARLQSPDQALSGLSAFQMRLHSMLPQLPTMEKLAQLSQEVSTNASAVSIAQSSP